MAEYTYSTSTGRYRDASTGRPVPEAVIREQIDALADATSGRLATLTERLLGGDIALAEWQRQAMLTIKAPYVAAGTIAAGGRAQMTPSAYGFLGRRIRTAYARLRDFANGIGDGSVPLDGRTVARAGMYGQEPRVGYEAIRARDAEKRGLTEERSMLHASESCESCRAQAALGWVALGTLVPIGSRTCLSRCKCAIERRSTPALRLVSRG